MVGFIGLGRMGSGMASNLVRRLREDLLVYDVAHTAVEALTDLGAAPAVDLAHVADECDVILLSLPGPPQVEEVVLGAHGLLHSLRPGTVLVDLSTDSLVLQRRIREELIARGCDLLDAPVSGGPAGAASGDLAIWVGGDRDAYDRCRPILEAIGDKVRHVGDFGSGTVTKLSHNMLGYMIMLSMAEVFSVAVKAGVDPLDLWESLRLGVVGKQSPLDMLTRQFLPGVYDVPAMALALAHKDMALGTDLAQHLGVPVRMAEATRAEMLEAVSRGLGDHDSRAYLQLQLERAGVEIAVDPQRLAETLEASASGVRQA